MVKDRDDAEWDDEGDEKDDGDNTIPCPYCRREIYEDSLRCPYCERYISDEDSPPGPVRWWIILGVLLSLAVVGLWLIIGN